MIRLARLVLLALKVTAGLVAFAVLTPWIVVLTPRGLIRGASIAFLWGLLAVIVLGAPAVIVGGVWSSLAAAGAWKRRDRASLYRAMRCVLLASSCLMGLVAIELVSLAMLRASERLPVLPHRFPRPDHRVSPGVHPRGTTVKKAGKSENPARATAAADGLYLVVIGESSARGEPYHPWLSVGQLVGWRLEGVFPGREIRVDVRADGGLCLEQAVLALSDLERRPDAVIVFAGHNEFQTRFGWSRDVRHYVEEGPESPLALFDLARSTSSAARLILKTLDGYYGEKPPPPRVTRALIDHPTCTPRHRAFLREDFERRLDALAAYCTRIGSVPILIMPGSNDGAFEPNRSVLSALTPAGLRAAFEREFLAVRAAEPGNTAASITAYRRLAEQHPEFAETHYRLGRLLALTGAWEEAGLHFVLARDLDGLPMRCPTDFRESYRSVASRYGAVLVDGPEVLSRKSPHRVLDDHLFHDAQHLNLTGIVALANETLEQLGRRRAFGWPESTPVPEIELEACARHFGLDAQKWATVCQRTSQFYARTAYMRYDPSERLKIAGQNAQAALDIAAGRTLGESTLPSLAMADSMLRAMQKLPPVTSTQPQ